MFRGNTNKPVCTSTIHISTIISRIINNFMSFANSIFVSISVLSNFLRHSAFMTYFTIQIALKINPNSQPPFAINQTFNQRLISLNLNNLLGALLVKALICTFLNVNFEDDDRRKSKFCLNNVVCGISFTDAFKLFVERVIDNATFPVYYAWLFKSKS